MFYLIASIIPAILFIFIVEQFGYFFVRSLGSILSYLNLSSSEDKPAKNSIIINYFVGMVVFAMCLFFLGIFRLFYPNVILYGSILVSLLIFVISKRWQNFSPQKTLDYFKENRFVYFGLAIFLGLSTITTFRPIDQFDGLWYHLAIPKMFLQEGNIDYSYEHLRYSVHPYLNFFWNAWSLSLPISIAMQGIVINWIQTFSVALALLLASLFGKQELKWDRIPQILSASIIGLFPISFFFFGTGYNDLYGFALGLVSVIYIYQLSKQEKISLVEFSIAFLLITGLVLLKIFFAIFAVLVYIYLFTTCFSKLEILKKEKANEPKLTYKVKVLGGILLSMVAVFILPWIIRSYFFTGRLLDPIGMPGLNEDAYNFAGSEYARNHWTLFIWERLAKNIFYITFVSFSPMFFLGFLSIFNNKIKESFKQLWFLGVVGFLVVFFASIVMELRYFLPSVSILLFLGFALLSEIYNKSDLFSKILIWILPIMFIPLSFLNSLSSDNLSARIYLKRAILYNESPDKTLESNLIGNIATYFPSKDSPIPKELNKKEKIFLIGVHNTAYIENPILDYVTNKNKFKGVKTAKDFFDVLKKENVRYTLIKRNDPELFCKNINLENPDDCKLGKYWVLDTNDEKQESKWLKLI